MVDSCKMVLKQFEAFYTFLWHHFFPILRRNFIPCRSSKLFSRPDCIFEIHQLWQTGCETLPPHPHHIISVFLPFHFLAGRWSTSGWGGNAHFFTYTRIRSRETGENRKTNEQTKLGVTKGRGRCCNTICMCRLSLAWVTSENSTMLLGSDILRLFFTGPYLVSSPLCSVSGVDCPSVDPRQLPLSCPVSTASAPVQLPTASLWVASSTLILGSPYHFRIRRDFMSKNPLSGFAPKQTIESSALAAYPHSATYPPLLPLSFILNKLQYDLKSKKKKTKTFTGSKNRTYKILKGFGRPLKKIINNITTPYHHTHKKKKKKKKKKYCWIQLFHLALLWTILGSPDSSLFFIPIGLFDSPPTVFNFSSIRPAPTQQNTGEF